MSGTFDEHRAPDASPDGPPGRGVADRRGSLAPDPDPALTVCEALALGAVLVVGVVVAVGTLLGHLDRWSLAATLTVSASVLVAVAAVVVRWSPPLRLDRTEIVIVAAVTALAAFMFLPGFPYAFGDKDPGIYVGQGFAVEREGTVRPHDPLASVRPPGPSADHLADTDLRFPGVWVDARDPGRVNPQFFDALATLFAAGIGLAGARGAFHLTPLLAVLSVGTLTLAVRRAFGPLAAVVAGVLLATNMLQVWQAKYPSTEILAQLLVHGAFLAGVLAVTTRWTPAAAAAGASTSLAFLVRPDGVLLVVLGIALIALTLATDRADRRVASFALGLSLPLPIALWQAYRANARYSAANDVPGLATTALVAIVLLGVGLALRQAVRHGWVVAARARVARAGHDRLRRAGGVFVVAASGLGMLVAFWRPHLFGETTAPTPDGGTRRLHNEDNLRRLSWFLTVPGIIGAWIGLATTALRRVSLAAIVLLGPGLLLLPIYVHRSRVSPRLMWWGRRYIPLVLAVLVVLLALAIVWTWTRRGRFRVAVATCGALLAGGVLVVALSQSLPLRHHAEFQGSYDVSAMIAAAASDDAVLLWVRPSEDPLDPLRNLPTPVWFVHGRPGAFLPPEPSVADLDRWRADLPDRELLVVADADGLPTGLAGASLVPVLEIDTDLPYWEEQTERRPRRPVRLPVRLTVWRLPTPDGRDQLSSPARIASLGDSAA